MANTTYTSCGWKKTMMGIYLGKLWGYKEYSRADVTKHIMFLNECSKIIEDSNDWLKLIHNRLIVIDNG